MLMSMRLILGDLIGSWNSKIQIIVGSITCIIIIPLIIGIKKYKTNTNEQ